MAAQDQVMSKNYFENNILKEEIYSKFCWHTEHEEIIDYLNCNKRFKENLKALPRKHSIPWLQKTATLGTSNIIQKVLQSETGNQSWYKRSIRKKISVTRDMMMTMMMMMMIISFWIHKLKQVALNRITTLLKEIRSTYMLLHVKF